MTNKEQREYIPKWITDKMKDQEAKINRLEEYLSNAVAPIYLCKHCGAKEESLRSISYCYKCNSTSLIKLSTIDLDAVKKASKS